MRSVPATTARGLRGRLGLLRHAAALAGWTGWHAARLGVRLLAPRRRGGASRRTRAGEELAALCERLGATYVKVGQILSSRPDLLPPDLVAPLARLQDALRPVPAAAIRHEIETCLGRPVEELFDGFDPVPLSAASVAQVHRARLADGREVAVKVRRPGIVERVDADFRLLGAAARLFARLPPLAAVPLPELVAEIAAPVREQLDLVREADNNRRLRAAFRHVEGVRLPALVDALCGDAVLTMEYLGGLEKVTSPRFTADQRRRAALAGLRALYRMIFRDGLIHADLHPGNVQLRGWGELVLLDTGLVARLDAAAQADFVDFFYGLANNRGRECARILWEGATWRAPGCDREAFETAVCALIARHSALRSRDFEVAVFVAQLIDTQRRHGLRGSTQFIMTVLSMVVYDGICKQLHPECDFQAEARPWLITARYGRRQGGRATEGVAEGSVDWRSVNGGSVKRGAAA